MQETQHRTTGIMTARRKRIAAAVSLILLFALCAAVVFKRYDIFRALVYHRPADCHVLLNPIIEDADRIVVRFGGIDCCGRVNETNILFKVTDPTEVAAVKSNLHFMAITTTNCFETICLCCGWPGMDWYTGKHRIALTAVQHGRGIRWRGFSTARLLGFRTGYGAAAFTEESRQWLHAWFLRRGVEIGGEPRRDNDYVPRGQHIRFQKEVVTMIEDASANPLPQEGIVFVGSSIFRLWETLEQDMAPLPVLNQAVSGSRTWEVLHHAGQLVLPHKPRIVVYYCGSNDINAGEEAAGIAERFRLFAQLVRERLPDTRIFFVSISRAPQKREKWHVVDEANRLVEAYCASRPGMGFIDVNPALFDREGMPRAELYLEDQLHFTPAAYQEFARIIKPVLERAWGEVND